LPRGRCGGIVAVVTAITVSPEETVGMLVKRWRERRRRSQLDVALAAGFDPAASRPRRFSAGREVFPEFRACHFE